MSLLHPAIYVMGFRGLFLQVTNQIKRFQSAVGEQEKPSENLEKIHAETIRKEVEALESISEADTNGDKAVSFEAKANEAEDIDEQGPILGPTLAETEAEDDPYNLPVTHEVTLEGWCLAKSRHPKTCFSHHVKSVPQATVRNLFSRGMDSFTICTLPLGIQDHFSYFEGLQDWSKLTVPYRTWEGHFLHRHRPQRVSTSIWEQGQQSAHLRLQWHEINHEELQASGSC